MCIYSCVYVQMGSHRPAAAKELAASSKSLRLAAIPSIGRRCITATLLPVLENGDCAGTVKTGAPDPAYAAPNSTHAPCLLLCTQCTPGWLSRHDDARLTVEVRVYLWVVEEHIGQRSRAVGDAVDTLQRHESITTNGNNRRDNRLRRTHLPRDRDLKIQNDLETNHTPWLPACVSSRIKGSAT